MSKLHMYREVAKRWTKFADGDGELSREKEFDVEITDGSVDKATVYQIRQGTKPDGSIYDCKKSATVNETARFKYSADLCALIDDTSAAASRALRTALLAETKLVTIQIAVEDLKTLKAADYQLCFAKRVGVADYNVVWQAYAKYLVKNKFSWTPQYQIFGSNTFQDKITVDVSTNIVTIGLGETSILDEDGIIEDAKTGGPTTSLTLVNEYGSIHPGVNQLSTGIHKEQISTPIYVSPEAIVKGTTSLTPVEQVLVWFQQDIETSTMFSASRSNAVEIDMTQIDEATRLYTDQKWIKI